MVVWRQSSPFGMAYFSVMVDIHFSREIAHKNPLKYGNSMGSARIGRGSHQLFGGPKGEIPYLEVQDT